MLFPLLFALAGPEDPAGVYYGRSGNLDVRPPRIEADVTVDGVLDEAAWARAALLTGFSQYSPTDGVPASDSTEVLIWYAPGAIYFGIRAYEAHGGVHATLADRDRIDADDFVQILLGTFGDGRQATVFAVNPLGVQSDGGVFSPRGVLVAGTDQAVNVVRQVAQLLKPIGADRVTKVDSSPEADIEPMVTLGVPGIGLDVDGTRYFWYHHTDGDTLDKLDPAEMGRCVALMAVMAYVIADLPDRLPS